MTVCMGIIHITIVMIAATDVTHICPYTNEHTKGTLWVTNYKLFFHSQDRVRNFTPSLGYNNYLYLNYTNHGCK